MQSPNILFLFTDQQRFDTVGALGNPWIKTPHLDRLCREGTAFTSAYTPSAECVPARCCLVTGQYVNRHGCGSNEQSMPPEHTPTFMSRLRDVGYRTHGVGKCHFTPNPEAMRGFETRMMSEELFGAEEQNDYDTFVRKQGYNHVLEPLGVRGEMYYLPQPSQVPAEAHHSQWVGNQCIDFIRKQKNREQPWLLYGGFIHPHPPFSPPSPWHKLYRAPDMPLPFLPEDDGSLICFINQFQNRYKYRDRGLDVNLIRCMRAYYAACISFVDFQLGRILQSLEEQGELDNTLIVYSSDHGELLGDFGCFGKRSFHDAAMRVPLLVRYPERFKAGVRCTQPVSLVDIAPTLCAASGRAQFPEGDGEDLALIAGGTSERDAVFFQYNRGKNTLAGVVSNEWKYAWSSPDQREYLFDRSEPTEKANLAGLEPTIPMREKLMQHVREGNFAKELLDGAPTFRAYHVRKMPADPDEGLIFQDPEHRTFTFPDAYV